MNEEFMLTTFDNPFNPFEEFESWFKTDLILGHDCCGLLARIANVSDVVSEEIEIKEVHQAMDQIIKDFPFIYRKVTRKDFKSDEIKVS